MAKEEIEFVDGLIVKAPHAKAPDFVKASIAIKVEDLGKWLREKYKAGDEWVNIDVKEAKSGADLEERGLAPAGRFQGPDGGRDLLHQGRQVLRRDGFAIDLNALLDPGEVRGGEHGRGLLCETTDETAAERLRREWRPL